jgi:hypothetical protein
MALAACLLAPGTALSACSSAPAALPACRNPEAAVLPHTAGSLTQSDTGTYCLGIGQTLDVFLTAPSASSVTRWSQITIADTSVLGYGNDGMMTPPLNVTPGVVTGVSRGTSTVTSTLPGGRTWSATVVVS